MKKLRFIIIVFTIIIFSGCGTGNHQSSIHDPEWNKNVYQLKGEILYPDTTILNIWDFLVVNDNLFIHQSLPSKEYSVYRLNGDSLKYKCNFINRGRGPNEVNNAFLFYLPEYDSLVAVGYNFYGRIIIMPYDDFLNEKSWRVSNNPVLQPTFDVIPIDTTRFIAQNIYDDAIYSSYRIGDDSLRKLSLEYPSSSEDLPPIDRSTFVFNSTTRRRPIGTEFVSSRLHGDYVQIFKVNADNSVEVIKTLFGEDIDYSVNGERTTVSGNTKYGLKFFVSQNYIYLCDMKLTYGNYMGDAKRNGYPEFYSTDIYVCDWEGNPVAKYVLDYPTWDYAVDSQEKYLYATIYDENLPEETIVRFPLPDISSADAVDPVTSK